MQLRWLSVPVVVALTLLGIWIFGGVVTNDFVTSMALVTIWFAALALSALVIARRSRSLRWPVLVSFVATSVIAGGALAYTTFHDRVVDEEVAVAGGGNVLVNRGRFVSGAHETSGRVEVVRMQDGSRSLTFTNLDTDAGPDLRVYLTAESIGSSDDAGEHVDLGGLKGNKGTQQYELPRELDLRRYSNVVIWCRAFSVAFGEAALIKAPKKVSATS